MYIIWCLLHHAVSSSPCHTDFLFPLNFHWPVLYDNVTEHNRADACLWLFYIRNTWTPLLIFITRTEQIASQPRLGEVPCSSLYYEIEWKHACHTSRVRTTIIHGPFQWPTNWCTILFKKSWIQTNVTNLTIKINIKRLSLMTVTSRWAEPTLKLLCILNICQTTDNAQIHNTFL
jgi:hypothetical protein